MGCASGCMKIVLHVMNFILLLFGLFYIAVAVLLMKSAPQLFIVYLFVIGGLIFVIALFGCCAICQENICMTTTYVALLVFLLVSQILGTVYGTDERKMKRAAADSVEKTWLEEMHNPGAMDNTQQTYKCCGKNGSYDYLNLDRGVYPASCYPDMIVDQTKIYQEGCVAAAEKMFVIFFSHSSKGQWGSVAFTVVAVAFSFYLLTRFRRKQRFSY